MSEGRKFIPALIEPGNVQAKINSITIKDRGYKNKEGNIITDVILNLETKPIGGNFKGMRKDSNDPNSPTYLGQIGRVKLNEWGYSDGQPIPDFILKRDEDILRALKSLFIETGTLSWLEAQHEKYSSPEGLIELFNRDLPFKDMYLYWCIASRQYTNSRGYTADDLYLPKYNKELGKPFSVEPAGIIIFDFKKHVQTPKKKDVDNFEATTNAPVESPKADTGESQSGIVQNHDENDKLPWE